MPPASFAYSSTVSTPYTAINNTNISNSLLQFAFKFIHFERDRAVLNESFASVSTQTQAPCSYLSFTSKICLTILPNNENLLCNAFLLSATSCLTSPNDSVRGDALRLLDKCHSMNVASSVDSFKWQTLIKKLTRKRLK